MQKPNVLNILGIFLISFSARPALAFGNNDSCIPRQISTQVVGTLVSNGQTYTQEISNDNYSDIFSSVSVAFTSLQNEIQQVINNKGRTISEFRSSSVQLGQTFEFQLQGLGTSAAVTILAPSISAQMYFKKEALFGLIEAQCTVSISSAHPIVTGRLNPASGTITNIDVKANASAQVSCSDNIPLLGGLIAGILDRLGTDAIQPTLNRINATNGLQLRSENFVGVNKMLSAQTFVAAGHNYGLDVAQKLDQFINTTNLNLTFNNVNLSPFTTGICGEGDPYKPSQTLLTLNIPAKNISLDIEIKRSVGGIYLGSSTGTGTRSTAATTPPLTSGTSSPTNGDLTARVKVLQEDLEQNFEVAPSIIELAHPSSTSTAVSDFSEETDSAIWTGVYLASQCFREVATQDAAEKNDAMTQINWALTSVENLFEVTGTSGLLARFAFDASDPHFQKLGILGRSTAANGWVESKTKPGWRWLSSPSRDQYTGILFGVGVCNQLISNTDIRGRTAAIVATAVTALEKNNWVIPLSNSQAGTTGNDIELGIQVAWLKLAALTGATATERASWNTLYESKLSTLMNNPIDALSESADPTFINNIYEYYAWNLGYLRYYPLLAYETNPTALTYFKNDMTAKYWNETYLQGNAEFTFIKIGTMGVSSSEDQLAVTQAVTSLRELAVRNRRDFAVNNSNNPSLGRNSIAGLIGNITDLYGLQSVPFFSQIASQQSAVPIPMSDRAPDVFMWEMSPFQLTGGGTGTIEAPSVDTIFAYWLGRYHQILNEQD